MLIASAAFSARFAAGLCLGRNNDAVSKGAQTVFFPEWRPTSVLARHREPSSDN